MLKNSNGSRLEVGIDEAGRGCLAGPVVAAAVCMPIDWDLLSDSDLSILKMIKDSKKMTKKNRNICRQFIENVAIDWGVGVSDNNEIDSINILRATHNAMHKALDNLNTVPEHIIVDGNRFKPYIHTSGEFITHTCFINGDNRYLSIAAASIIAKVYRDNYITRLSEDNEELKIYDWENNKGYGTKKHINAIMEYGISKYHRKTFGICSKYVCK